MFGQILVFVAASVFLQYPDEIATKNKLAEEMQFSESRLFAISKESDREIRTQPFFPKNVTFLTGRDSKDSDLLRRNTEIFKAVYGHDDRYEPIRCEEKIQAAASSICLLTESQNVTARDDGRWNIATTPYTVAGFRGCIGEPFAEQPVGGFCSGFLVSPDIVVTAGHCQPPGSRPENTAFVFGFRLNAERGIPDAYESSMIIRGREIIASKLDLKNDFSIVRLEQPVDARVALPLRVRKEREVAAKEGIGVIGHPAGLPSKAAFGKDTKVLDVTTGNFFVTNLDAFGGNSGSPVFDALEFHVVGILVQGASDYLVDYERGCFSSRFYDQSEGYEKVMKATVFGAEIP